MTKLLGKYHCNVLSLWFRAFFFFFFVASIALSLWLYTFSSGSAFKFSVDIRDRHFKQKSYSIFSGNYLTILRRLSSPIDVVEL